MNGYIDRLCFKSILYQMKNYPVTALLGPRQVGKSTLAKKIQTRIKKSFYLDLQDPVSLSRLEDPIALFDQYKNSLIILDEIQKVPDFFSVLRSLVDKKRRNGQVLVLGSAGRDLIRQSAETLAGRICYIEVTPFQQKEVSRFCPFSKYWLRGGYPLSLLSKNARDSLDWRKNYIRTFVERDIPQLGLGGLSPSLMSRLWKMLAHLQGQILNQSKLGQSLAVSSVSIRKYISILEQAFIVRQVLPYSANLKKRLVKSPKIYIRDSGLLHAVLNVESHEDLRSHPVCGASFEGVVLENIICQFPDWEAFFIRTSNGAEADLILTKGRKKILFEVKLNASYPKASKGFFQLMRDILPGEAFVIAPLKESFKSQGITYSSLEEFLRKKRSGVLS